MKRTYADDFKNDYPQAEIDGGWTCSKPYPDPLIFRIKSAIDVLWGHAVAVYFRGQ